MRTFTGTKAAAGLTIGPVVHIDHGAAGLHRIVCDPFRERALYEAAIVLAKDELNRLQQHAQGQDADILLFQIALLDDESFTNEIGDYIAAGAGSAAAVERAERIFAGRISNIDDAYIRERSVDVCDACRRVVDILDGRPRRPLRLTEPSILAADLFYPSDLFSLDHRLILGLVADHDSTTSHAAILARSMGVPALVRLGEGTADLAAGHRAVLDAEDGILIIDPTPAQRAAAQKKLARLATRGQKPDPLFELPCLTRDGTRFTLLTSGNCSSPQDAEAALRAGTDGIGLVRTESVVLNNMGEEEQYALYRAFLRNAPGTPVTVRTCDPGADDGALWSYSVHDRMEREPAFRAQACALLRAGVDCDLRVVLPMVPDVDEWDAALRRVELYKQQMDARGLVYNHDLPFGCMIEIPSAALLAGEIIDHGARFLVIDIDDLTQYTCAVSRKDDTQKYRVDSPAVLRLVRGVLEAAHARGVPVYICGITEAELPAMRAYLKVGVRTFCTEPAFVAPLKANLREVDLREGGGKGEDATAEI